MGDQSPAAVQTPRRKTAGTIYQRAAACCCEGSPKSRTARIQIRDDERGHFFSTFVPRSLALRATDSSDASSCGCGVNPTNSSRSYGAINNQWLQIDCSEGSPVSP